MLPESLRYAQRAYRLGDGYGPMTLPQGNGAPAPPEASTVLFDFDPSYSMLKDRVGGIALTDPVGGVKKVVANGRIAAQFDGTNYLLGASSPFAALSDLTGGVSIYIVAEITAAGTAAMGLFSLDNDASNANTNYLAVYTQGTTDKDLALSADPVGLEFNATDIALARNVIRTASLHATTGVVGIRNSGRLAGATTAAGDPHDPTGLNRTVIGANAIFGNPHVVNVQTECRVYRVLVCEGAFSQAIADHLAELYTPVRIPPGIAAADIAFVFDARAGMYRDLRNGITLTPASLPSRVSRGGDVAAFFDGVDDDLQGPLVLGAMSGNWTLYIVEEPQDTGVQYLFGVEDASAPTAELLAVGANVAGGGGIALRREAGVQVADLSAVASVLGKVELLTAAFTAASVELFTNGVTDGASADTKTPQNIDLVTLGGVIGGAFHGDGYIYYALIVNSARDAAVEAWINSQFPVGVSP